MLLELDEPRYPLAEIAAAARTPVNTLRSWYQRGHFVLGVADRAAAKAGVPRMLTLRRALNIGVAVELIRNGVEPGVAGRVAQDFSDIGDRDARASGELYPDGHTIMVLFSDEPMGHVIKMAPTDGWPLLFAAGMHGGRNASAVVVNCNEVVDHMRLHLGVRR